MAYSLIKRLMATEKERNILLAELGRDQKESEPFDTRMFHVVFSGSLIALALVALGVALGSEVFSPQIQYKGWKFVKDDLAWEWGKPEDEPNPYQLEWDHLVEAIRNDKPYNEAKRGAMASLVTAMGRIAAHTGQVVTYDEKLPSLLSVEHDLGPDVDNLVLGGPAPVQADKDGRYPVPQPGRKKDREF